MTNTRPGVPHDSHRSQAPWKRERNGARDVELPIQGLKSGLQVRLQLLFRVVEEGSLLFEK